jgi:hypothetical protein
MATSSYRHFYVENADVCDEEAAKPLGDAARRKLVVGSGAAILQLKAPSTTFQVSQGLTCVCSVFGGALRRPEPQQG